LVGDGSNPWVRQPEVRGTSGWTPIALEASGGPEEPLNVARRDARVADATRDGHIPITRSRSKRPPCVAFLIEG
jgi:hypothetical protein